MTTLHNLLLAPQKMWQTYHFNARHFGTAPACYQTLDIAGRHTPQAIWSRWVAERKHLSITNWLERELTDEIETFGWTEPPLLPHHHSPVIWQCWWQGGNRLNDITKICTDSVRQHSAGHPVILITQDNYGDYITLPPHIMDKVGRGLITLTELSDIVRMNLLNQHGGLWLDTTVLLTSALGAEAFHAPFYTCKESPRDHRFVSLYRWNSSCIGGCAHHPLFAFVAGLLNAYWSKYDVLIDYYLIDYLIDLACRHDAAARDLIDRLPYNQPRKHEMQPWLNRAYNDAVWRQLTSETQVFKLSRKTPYHTTDRYGRPTLYAHLAKLYL